MANYGEKPDRPLARSTIVADEQTIDLASGAGHRPVAGAIVEGGLAGHALSLVSDGIAIIDSTGRIQQVNPAFEKLVDLPNDRIVSLSAFDPPWSWLTSEGDLLNQELSPEVRALRHQRTSDAPSLKLRGNGRNRGIDDVALVDVSAEPSFDESGQIRGVVLILTDLSEQAYIRDQIERLRSIDPLTGLKSRATITRRTADLIRNVSSATHGSENAHTRVGVLHLNLDDFRSVNDTFGSTVGDTVLTSLAGRLGDLAARHVEVGRIGVDEFLVVTTGGGASLEFDARLRRLAEELQRRTEAPFDIDGIDLRFTSSIGISRYPGNAETAAELLRTADAATTAARREGRQRVRFYDSSMDELTRTGLALDMDLRRAAAQRTLEVHYQPIIDLRTGAVAAAEALLRWHHHEHGPISPAIFIASAEATGAISCVSDMVVSTVAADLAGWNSRALLPAGARIAINISAAEFEQREFVRRLVTTIEEAGVSPSQLELEITETMLMRDMEAAALRLRTLDDLGFLVALDDFGTGYSSLSYLHTLPLHTLKIDRSFIRDLGNGKSDTITKSIVSLAQGLGIGTVAEGVETEHQRRFLNAAGCDLVQGYYYAPPMPRAAFENFLLEHSPDPQIEAVNQLHR